MNDLTQSHAPQIAAEHEAAQQHADKAIEHAKRAGALLLEVKAQLDHGQFLPWIDDHLNVSRRQVQRYMRAAQGKPMTARRLKSDTVSHLPDWLPEAGQLASADLGNDAWIEVQARAHAPEYFQFLIINGFNADYTRRGLRPEHVEEMILNTLPRMLAGDGPPCFDWQYTQHTPEYLANQINLLEQAA